MGHAQPSRATGRHRFSAFSTPTARTSGVSSSPRSGGRTQRTASRRPSSRRCAPIRVCGPRVSNNLRAWVLTIAHRKALDVHRRRAKGALPVAEIAAVVDGDGRAAGRRHVHLVGRRARASRASATRRCGRPCTSCRRASARRSCCATSADLPHRDIAARDRLLGGGGAPLTARGTEQTEEGDRMTEKIEQTAPPGRSRGSRRRATTRSRPRRELSERAARRRLRRHQLRARRLPLRHAATPPSPSAAWCASPSPRRASSRCSNASREASRRGSSRRPRRSTRSSASWTSTSPGAASAFEVPLDWSLIGPFGRRVLHATAAIPYGGVLSYAEVATEAGSPARLARRRQRARLQPDPDRDPLPPRAAQRRRARRLRRRTRPQALSARARGVAHASAVAISPALEGASRFGARGAPSRRANLTPRR